MKSFNENEQGAVLAEEKAAKIFVVNCNRCGAALKVKDGAYAYICGACNNLFQIRKIEKIIQPVVPKAKEESVVEDSLAEDSVQLDISDIELQPTETSAEAEEPVVEDTAAEEDSIFGETEEGAAVTSEPIKPTQEEEDELMEQFTHEDSDAFERYGYYANESDESADDGASDPAWEPITDEGEEDGWDDDTRESEMSEWQEEEPEEGWDDEDLL